MKSVFIMLIAINMCLFTYFHHATSAPVIQHSVAPQIEGGGILLLNEVESGPVEKHSTQSTLVENEQFMLCVLYGPFKELLKAEYLIEALADKSVKGSLERVSYEINKVYFVLGEHNSSQPVDAKRRLIELSRQNISAHLYREGGQERIAFARYNDISKAEQKIKELNNVGVDAEIVEKEIPSQEHWVRINKQDDQALVDDGAMKDFFIQNRVEKRIIRCLGVAKS